MSPPVFSSAYFKMGIMVKLQNTGLWTIFPSNGDYACCRYASNVLQKDRRHGIGSVGRNGSKFYNGL